jgi:hypothetical protein
MFNNVPNGNYILTVRDENGCTDTAGVTVNNVSVVDPAAVWGLQVLPNPGAGRFLLRFADAPSRFQADVFDAAGKLLQSREVGSAGGVFQTEIDLTALPQGMYLLRLTDGRRTGAVPLVVQR